MGLAFLNDIRTALVYHAPRLPPQTAQMTNDGANPPSTANPAGNNVNLSARAVVATYFHRHEPITGGVLDSSVR